jgi:hypothetical protein
VKPTFIPSLVVVKLRKKTTPTGVKTKSMKPMLPKRAQNPPNFRNIDSFKGRLARGELVI